MTNTPETDKETGQYGENDLYFGLVTADFARRLELERDQARREAEKVRKEEVGLTPEIVRENPEAHPRFSWENVTAQLPPRSGSKTKQDASGG